MIYLTEIKIDDFEPKSMSFRQLIADTDVKSAELALQLDCARYDHGKAPAPTNRTTLCRIISKC